MSDDRVVIKVSVGDGRETVLEFRPDVYTRIVLEARKQRCSLHDYLLKRIIASGLGEG